MIKIDDGGFAESDEASNSGSFRDNNDHNGDYSKRHSEGVLAPINWRCTSNMGNFGAVSDGLGNENKVKKVKLKVGGITRTINAKSAQDGSAGAGSTRSYHYSDTQQPRQKLIIQVYTNPNLLLVFLPNFGSHSCSIASEILSHTTSSHLGTVSRKAFRLFAFFFFLSFIFEHLPYLYMVTCRFITVLKYTSSNVRIKLLHFV